MWRYLSGKVERGVLGGGGGLFEADCRDVIYNVPTATSPLQFSATAQMVFDAGRELWRYYHAQSGANVDASLYDIREHFQGRAAGGRMNNKSADEQYNKLIASLRDALRLLAKKIEGGVYRYGFLR